MTDTFDEIDRAILAELQRDAGRSVEAVADAVHLSRNACWRRIKVLEAAGVIRGRVALLDPEKLGCPLMAVVQVRTSRHDGDWRQEFRRAVRAMPEITAAYRMTGDLDYLLHVRLADMAAYDRFYRDLTSRIAVSDMSASFVMEELRDSPALPL